ncbi:MAG TPA: zinc ABC transporter substrate-binding protein, partial [Beijerinckiaceae bacterium]|nr:zinc ABC transporter substrate-binding protein [Beijerinckiaceae bacterium]
FAASLEDLDPPNSAHYSHNLFRFDASMIPLSAKMKNLWKYYRKSTVLVTDNLFQPVLELLEFVIVDTAFEKENENRMALADGGAILRKDIAQKKASILVYDSEQQSPVLTKLVAMANQTGVPAVGVRKTKPASLSYQEWMIRELNALHGALNEAAQ